MVVPAVSMPDATLTYVVSIVLVSLYVSSTAVVLSTLVSVPTALAIGFADFPGKRVVTTVINTGMGFPSVVVGLLVLLVFSNQGPLGDLELAFTPTAMVASQFVLATPVITSITLSAVEGVGQDVRDAAFALGGTDTDVGIVVIREARQGRYEAGLVLGALLLVLVLGVNWLGSWVRGRGREEGSP